MITLYNLLVQNIHQCIQDAAYYSSSLTLWRWLLPRSLLQWFISPLQQVNFVPDSLISSLYLPILMIHSLDDPVIPVDLARELFRASHHLADKENIQLIEIDEHLGHSDFYRSKSLPSMIAKFARKC